MEQVEGGRGRHLGLAFDPDGRAVQVRAEADLQQEMGRYDPRTGLALGPTRTEADFVGPSEQTVATDPLAGWVFVVDNLNTHQSFNADPTRPAKFLVYKSRTFDYASFAGIEHFEDASPR